MATLFEEVANYLFGSYKVRATKVTVSNAPDAGTSQALVQHVMLDDGTGTAALSDPLAKYKISDLEEAATSYYGNLATDGSWYILSLTATAARYAKGDSGYVAAWTGRAGLTYDYFDVVF